MKILRMACVAGLFYAAHTAAEAAESLPFDCARAHSASEKAICRTPSLLQADATITTLFDIATSSVLMGQRGDLRDAQRAWLATRDSCGGDVACLSSAYASRIDELTRIQKSLQQTR